MDLEDTLSVVLSFCDCGSNYKSWVMVSRLWNCVSCKRFPRAKLIFGNRITNLIEDTDSADIIRTKNHTKFQVAINPKIPKRWKDRNDFGHQEEEIHFPYHKMRHLYENHGVSFYSHIIFNRPFEKDEFLEFFYNILSDFDNRNDGFIVGDNFEFHSSISMKDILLAKDYISVAWYKIPVSHWDVLTVDDWKFLEDRGVTPKYPVDVNQLPTTDDRMEYWCKYPTTTPEMIHKVNGMMIESRHYHGYIGYSVDYFVLLCVNLSYDQTVSILKKNRDYPSRFETLWHAILK